MMRTQSPAPTAPRRLIGLVAATVVLGAVLGAVLARLVLPHDSTAEARLVVGDQSLSAQAVPGYAVATQQVATTYARLVSSDEVRQTVRGDVRSVEATAIPDSAIIRVQATAGDDADALAAAKAGSRRLIAIADQARHADGANGTRTRYSTAYRSLQAANRALAAAKARGDQGAEDAAARRVAQAQLDVQSLASLYTQQVAADGTDSSAVMTISQPTIVGQQAMRLPLLGALLGAFVVAALWALRAMTRRTRAAAQLPPGDEPTATAARDRGKDVDHAVTLPKDTDERASRRRSGAGSR